MLSMTTLYISGRFFFDLYGKKISEKVKIKIKSVEDYVPTPGVAYEDATSREQKESCT